MQEGDDTLLLPSVRELLQKTPQSRAPLPNPRPELPLSKRRKGNEAVRPIPSPNTDDPEIFSELIQLKANIVEVISDHRQLSPWKDVGADALEEALLSATSTPAKKQAYSAAPSAHGQEQNTVDAILIETSSRLDRILFAEKSLRSKIAAFIHHELITTVSTYTAN